MKAISFLCKTGEITVLVRNISEIGPGRDSSMGVRLHMANGHYYYTDDYSYQQLKDIVEETEE